jgi:hypothetical protein
MKPIILTIIIAALSGCVTTYRICLPGADECSEIRSYRKMDLIEASYSETDGLKVKMEGVDRQTASPLEEAAADALRNQAGL